MKRIKIGEMEKEVLKAVGVGVIVLASIILPGLPMVLAPFVKKRGPTNFKKSLKKMEDKGLIFLGGDKIKLTKRGKALLRQIQCSEIEINRPKKWDKEWHLVSYDIPKEYNKERDWFRWNLKRLGFRQIQESLWVHAFECSQEIAVIAQSLKISPHVVIMRADQIPRQEEIKKYFDLQ